MLSWRTLFLVLWSRCIFFLVQKPIPPSSISLQSVVSWVYKEKNSWSRTHMASGPLSNNKPSLVKKKKKKLELPIISPLLLAHIHAFFFI